MNHLILENIDSKVKDKVRLFIEEAKKNYSGDILSVHLYGSSATDEYDRDTSDINSIFVLEKMDMDFLRAMAPLGKKHGKQRIAVPLIMTPEYIGNSLDVFPVEFLDIKLIHKTITGEDIFAGLDFRKDDMRRQCERELKVKLIALRQGYIASQADREGLLRLIVSTMAGCIALFRGIIFVYEKKPPVKKDEVLKTLFVLTGIDIEIFRKILEIRKGREKLKSGDLHQIFEKYYAEIENLSAIMNEIR